MFAGLRRNGALYALWNSAAHPHGASMMQRQKNGPADWLQGRLNLCAELMLLAFLYGHRRRRL